VHNQTVTITGAGYTPEADIGMAECEAGAFSPEGCDLSAISFVQADAAGAWSTTLTVRRAIRNAYERIDCVAAPGACVIGAANIGDFTESASAPLAFDPTVPPPPPPVVTVAPATGLVHDQQVIVVGEGFHPGAFLSVSQCLAGAFGFQDCDYSTGLYLQAGADGRFATGLTVRHRIFTSSKGVVDCGAAPAPCEIRAEDQADVLDGAGAPISFDPNVPPPPPPVVTVTPDTDLVHRQSVSVQGSGFSPGASIGITQCEAGVVSFEHCDYANATYATADASGAWAASFPVHRVIRNAYELVDCTTGPGACVISAANTYDYAESGAVAISFDPDVPAPPPPVVTATPSTGLAHGERVLLTGSGFGANTYVDLVECIAGSTDSADCDYGTSRYEQTGERGGFKFRFTVRRVIRTYSSGDVDCTEIPQGCEIRFEDYSDPLATGRVAIGFDPDIPLPPPPTLTVTPSTGLVNRQTVQVAGSGYPPNDEVQLEVCEAETAETTAAKEGPFLPASCDYYGGASTDAAGSFSAPVKVHRLLLGYRETPVDCAEVACVLRAESYVDALAVADTPIDFDGSTPPPPPYPVIEVAPTTGLDDGTSVTVKGSGFAPSAPIGIGQCHNPPASERDCETANAVQITSDDKGEFTATIDVQRVIATANVATIDCGGLAGRCLIGVANLDDTYGEYALSTGLRFDPPPPQPPPPNPPPPTNPSGGGGQTTVLGGNLTGGASSGNSLARTGGDLDVQALAGLSVLVLGLMLLVAARWRAATAKAS
jgi:hypothetical protein